MPEQPGDRIALPRSSRVGLLLFACYCAFYAGFIALVAFAPAAMKAEALGGVNLAVIYGLGLIVGALVLALIYVRARRNDVEQP